MASFTFMDEEHTNKLMASFTNKLMAFMDEEHTNKLMASFTCYG